MPVANTPIRRFLQRRPQLPINLLLLCTFSRLDLLLPQLFSRLVLLLHQFFSRPDLFSLLPLFLFIHRVCCKFLLLLVIFGCPLLLQDQLLLRELVKMLFLLCIFSGSEGFKLLPLLFDVRLDLRLLQFIFVRLVRLLCPVIGGLRQAGV